MTTAYLELFIYLNLSKTWSRLLFNLKSWHPVWNVENVAKRRSKRAKRRSEATSLSPPRHGLCAGHDGCQRHYFFFIESNHHNSQHDLNRKNVFFDEKTRREKQNQMQIRSRRDLARNAAQRDATKRGPSPSLHMENGIQLIREFVQKKCVHLARLGGCFFLLWGQDCISLDLDRGGSDITASIQIKKPGQIKEDKLLQLRISAPIDNKHHGRNSQLRFSWHFFPGPMWNAWRGTVHTVGIEKGQSCY